MPIVNARGSTTRTRRRYARAWTIDDAILTLAQHRIAFKHKMAATVLWERVTRERYEIGEDVPDIPNPEDCPVCCATHQGSTCAMCLTMHQIHRSKPTRDLAWYTPYIFIHPASNQLCATTLRHPPVALTEDDLVAIQRNLRGCLLHWIELNTDWSPQTAPSRAAIFARFGLFVGITTPLPFSEYTFLSHMAFHPALDSDEDMLTQLVGTGEIVTTTAEHVAVYMNVFECVSQLEGCPSAVADAIAHTTQEFVGYFHGAPVTSGRMQMIDRTPLGEFYDTSVATINEPWQEPFEIADDCAFCEELTDDRIRERIDGFQWAMDKELAFTVPAHDGGYPDGYPRELGKPGDWEVRAEFRRRQLEWEWTNPAGMKSYFLHDLPAHLQRALVVRWNHIWRDWILSDARYSWRDGHLYMVFNPKLRYWRNIGDSPGYFKLDSTLANPERVVAFDELPAVEAALGHPWENSFAEDDEAPISNVRFKCVGNADVRMKHIDETMTGSGSGSGLNPYAFMAAAYAANLAQQLAEDYPV